MKCINPTQLTKNSRNLKFVAFETAEISSIQISTNDRTASPAEICGVVVNGGDIGALGTATTDFFEQFSSHFKPGK
jgi:hypothetical protein